MLHCCPSGYTCNLATQMCEKHRLPWFHIPMVMEKAEKSSALVLPASSPREFEDNRIPAEEKGSNVHCDSYYQCPDGTTCCKVPGGTWACCLYSPVSSATWPLTLKDPVKSMIYYFISTHTYRTDTKLVAGQLLSGWPTLLSHGLPMRSYFHTLLNAGPEISLSSQRTALCVPGCPHCCPRGKTHVAGGTLMLLL